MSLDLEVLAERVSAVERHLARVAQKLPPSPAELLPNSDAADAVILHLWQATQIVLDIALGACAQRRLGTPAGYADAFVRLGAAGVVDPALARRLAAAAGFRNVVAHAYESIDLARVYQAAVHGPADLRAFLAIIRDALAAR
ncbi:MAG TPA: DUF86 domain-containing protein [Polyangiales bacterium]